MTVDSTEIMKIPVNSSSIRRAAETSIRKLPHISSGFIDNRTKKKRLENSFQGDLAKLSVMDYLRMNGKIITDDYDVIRTDNFIQSMNRGYHFKMDNIRIESNSSKLPPRKTSVWDSGLLNMDIKISQSENGTFFPLFEDYDIAIQMYFDIQSNEEIFIFSNVNSAINYLIDGSIDIESRIDFLLSCLNTELNLYFFAFVEENILRQLPYFNRTWSFPGSERKFYECKIKDCEPFSKL